MGGEKIKISDYIKNKKPKLYKKMERYHYLSSNSSGPLLRTVDIGVTSLCNLRCGYCYASSYNFFNDLSLEAWKKAIDEIKSMGAFHFILQGGEPLAAPGRLEEIVRFLQPEESFLNLVSNGMLIKEDTLLWLKELGIDKICISLDSAIAEEHDRNRGIAGCHKKAVEAIFLAREKGFQVAFSTVISHQNLHSEGIQQLFDFAIKHRLRMDIQVIAPIGMLCGKTDIVCTPEDAEYIKNKMETAYVEDATGQIYLINRDIFPRYGKMGCPAVKNFISITPSGEILPCTFLHISMGNIEKDSVREAVKKALNIHWFREYHQTCLSGEDKEFICKYLIPAAKSPCERKGFKNTEEIFYDECKVR